MKKNLGIGILVCLICFGAAWALGWFDSQYSDDPEVAKLEKMRDELVDKSEEQRRAARGQFQEAMENMTEQQRESFMESSMPIFVKMGAAHMEKRFDEFLEMSPEEQIVEMDKRIDEQIAREKSEGGSGPGRGGPPNMSPDKMDEFRKKMQDWTTPDQRAKFETVMGMYNKRREQRGLDPMEGPWRR